MAASNLWNQALAWIARTRSWLSGRAVLRRDAAELARMGPRQLRDLGLWEAGAAGSGITMTECGPVAHGNWMHAKPCFPRRAIRRD